jgi:hypothetical protein
MSSFLTDISLANNGAGTSSDRYVGGSSRTTESDHPYIKGYFYVFFGLPSTLFSGSTINSNIAKNYLLSSAESFTPHADRQMNVQDTQGMGGAGGASFITGQNITRDFSIQYREYWGSPIMRIHRNWTGYLDPYLGVSVIAKNFTANEYKGSCMVIQTKPVARKVGDNATDWSTNDIIKVYYYDGVQCLTDLNSAYDANIADNSIVKPSVQYRFDGYPLTETNPNVLKTAVDVLNNAKIFDNTVELYNKLMDNSNIKNGTI